MKTNDAAEILGLTGEITPEQTKAAYKAAALKFHPDINPAGLEMMKIINAAFDSLKDFAGNIEAAVSNYAEFLNDALNAIFHTGLDIEICGAWVWVSGDTKPHKETLKAAGYRWASKKKKWYYRPEGWKSSSRGKWSMDKIRTYHGSTTPNRTEQDRLTV